MKITRFEDLDAWKAAKKVMELVIAATESPKFPAGSLKDQILDAADSTMSNITEGFKAGSDREFIRFLKMALRSCAEVQSHMYVAEMRKFVTRVVFDSIYQACEDTRGLIGGLIRYLSRPRPPKRQVSG